MYMYRQIDRDDIQIDQYILDIDAHTTAINKKTINLKDSKKEYMKHFGWRKIKGETMQLCYNLKNKGKN